jgi:hypothetical protein
VKLSDTCAPWILSSYAFPGFVYSRGGKLGIDSPGVVRATPLKFSETLEDESGSLVGRLGTDHDGLPTTTFSSPHLSFAIENGSFALRAPVAERAGHPPLLPKG